MLEDWLKTRPECVQALAREFPVPARMVLDGITYALIGYTENDMLIFAPEADLRIDYQDASENKKIHICASHLRNQASAQTGVK